MTLASQAQALVHLTTIFDPGQTCNLSKANQKLSLELFGLELEEKRPSFLGHRASGI